MYTRSAGLSTEGIVENEDAISTVHLAYMHLLEAPPCSNPAAAFHEH